MRGEPRSMLRYRLATPAKRDLVKILEYLVQNAGGRVALDVESRLRKTFQLVAARPGVGHTRTDLTSKPALFLAEGRYLVVYRVDPAEVLIVAILDGARDVRFILGRRRF
jgi:plasmid stabilization system protein ParE